MSYFRKIFFPLHKHKFPCPTQGSCDCVADYLVIDSFKESVESSSQVDDAHHSTNVHPFEV